MYKNVEKKTKIELKDLSFRYPESEKWILEDANLEIQKNTSDSSDRYFCRIGDTGFQLNPVA